MSVGGLRKTRAEEGRSRNTRDQCQTEAGIPTAKLKFHGVRYCGWLRFFIRRRTSAAMPNAAASNKMLKAYARASHDTRADDRKQHQPGDASETLTAPVNVRYAGCW